jgi:hypothetical protein
MRSRSFPGDLESSSNWSERDFDFEDSSYENTVCLPSYEKTVYFPSDPECMNYWFFPELEEE